MNKDFRERAFLPLAIPIGALAAIALVTIGFSRILLNVPKQVATAVAIGVAINILIVCAVLAARKGMTQSQFMVFITAAIVPLAVGGAVAAGVLEVGGPKEGEEAGAEKLAVSAVNLLFEPGELKVKAGHKIELAFENKDRGVQHNVAVFNGPDASSPNVFRGDIFPGPKTVTYEIPSLEAGSYYFHCDIHPATMKGTLLVEAGEAEAPPEGESTGAAKPEPAGQASEVRAKNIAFLPTELEWSAGSPVKLSFKNDDAGQLHNVSIFKGPDASSPNVFRGQVFQGVRTVTYDIPALESGSYYFQCDVHTNMKGKLRVT